MRFSGQQPALQNNNNSLSQPEQYEDDDEEEDFEELSAYVGGLRPGCDVECYLQGLLWCIDMYTTGR